MKKTSLFLIIIAIVLVTFTGCGQPKPPSNADKNITGEIRNALTSELVKGSVLLHVDDKAFTVTGGTFALENITEGSHTLRIEHTGFIKYEQTVALKAGNKIVITLIPNGAPTAQASWAPKDNHHVIGIKVRNNQIYVSAQNEILRYTLDGTYIDAFATGIAGNCSFITFDAAGNLWGIDGVSRVVRFDASGAIARKYEGLLSFAENWGLALDETHFYVGDLGTNKVTKYAQADGSLVAEIGAAAGIAFNYVTQLAFGPDGNLYAGDLMNGRIVVLSKDLSVVRTFSTMAEGETLSGPLAMAFGPDGFLYVHDRRNYCIKKIGPDDSIIQKIPIPGVLFINGLAFDDYGTLYATDNTPDNRKIHVFSWSE